MQAFRIAAAVAVSLAASLAFADQRGAKPAPPKPPAAPQFFTTPLTLDDMRNKAKDHRIEPATAAPAAVRTQ